MGGISPNDLTKDAEGNRYINFDESSQNREQPNGKRLIDYEILQVISADNQNFVAKVRSSNNNQIYAMKKIDLSKYNFIDGIEFIDNFFEKLKSLNNPHLLKYYNSFYDNNDFYIIMEYMNNSDIIGFIQARKILNEKISEEEIWNILLQCLSGLDYLHSQKFENLGIKLTNIFMNNEQNIKIGAFNEIVGDNINVDPTDDIYFLGKFFYAMMNLQKMDEKTISEKKNISKITYSKVNNNFYSIELQEIINSMSKENNKNIKVSTIYKTVKEQYVKKYAKNTSIEAVLRCLASYTKLTEKFDDKQKKKFEQNKEKYYINYWYGRALDAISGFNEGKELTLCIEEFRRAIAYSYSKLDGSKEIDPLLLLTFLLVMMHKETNEVEEIQEENKKQKRNSVISSSYDGEEEDKTNKMQMWNRFITQFNKEVNSPISELFFFFVKRKRLCQTCRTGYYSFYHSLYIVFDLSDRNSNKKFDLINDGFKFRHTNYKMIDEDGNDKMMCERCSSYQRYKEFNRYYMLNNHLIICFIRGNNYKNKSKIEFTENLDLKDFVEPDINSPHNFYLTGSVIRSIKQNDEKFISYSRDPYNEYMWHCTNTYIDVPNKENKFYTPFTDIKKEEDNGQIIMLFYNRIESIGK